MQIGPKECTAKTNNERALPESRADRYVLADALRGIASLWVAIYHQTGILVDVVESPLPGWFDSLYRWGFHGVNIFFVLSGFVIAHSISGHCISPRFFGRFVVRRGLRLDPPYWATIALALLEMEWSRRFYSGAQVHLPEWSTVVANMFYVQTFVGKPHVADVFWTLCLEVRFYLIFVLLCGASQWLSRVSKRPVGWYQVLFFGPLLLWGLLVASGQLPVLNPRFFMRRWPMFFYGVLAYWAFQRKLPLVAFWALLLLGILMVIPFAPSEMSREFIMTGLTSALLFWAGKTGRIVSWTLGRPVQFLGRISYSMYLIHTLTGSRIMSFAKTLIGGTLNFPGLVCILFLGLSTTVAASYLFYLLVEAPSHRLSKRISMGNQTRLIPR